MEISLDRSGEIEIKRALEFFQLSLRKDVRQAVKKGAYEASRSLIARTKPTSRKSYRGPEIALATQADADALATRIKTPAHWHGTPDSFRHYVQTLAGAAYIARSDRPKDNGYRRNDIWRKDKYSKSELKKKLAYRYAGLAKTSWRWCANKTKGGRAALNANGDIVGIAAANCAVRPSPDGLEIVITNRLGYIRSALTSPSAVNDALRAAARSMIGQVRRQLEKRAARASA